MPAFLRPRRLFALLLLAAAVLPGCSDTAQRIETGGDIQQALQQQYQAETVGVQVRSGDTTRVEITLTDPADTTATTRADALPLAQTAREHYTGSDSLEEVRVTFAPPSEGGAGELSRTRRYTFSADELR